MSDRLIFVSCGLRTPEEKQFGRSVQEAIDSCEGFEAYFADSVQSLAALRDHIFDALRCCAGAVALLHARKDGSSSMWINQELAVLAYRQFFESAEIPILVFKEESVTIAGAMTAFIVNAKPLADEQTVIADVHNWLKHKASEGRADEHAIFAEKWAALRPEDHRVLKALVDEGGLDVKESSIRHRLIESHGRENNAALDTLNSRLVSLRQATLIQRNHVIYDGNAVSLHPSWQWYARHEVRKQ